MTHNDISESADAFRRPLRRGRKQTLGDWNVIVSVRKGSFNRARRFLREFGVVGPSGFLNVLVIRVDDPQRLLEALAESSWQVVGTFTDGADRPTAKSNAADVLSKYPGLKGIVGLWGYNGFCAAKALEDSPGREVKIVAADEDIETIAAIRQGKIYASIVQQPYEFGYQSIKMLARLHRKEPVQLPQNKLIYVPIRVMDRNNASEIEAEVNAKLALRQRLLAQPR